MIYSHSDCFIFAAADNKDIVFNENKYEFIFQKFTDQIF